MWIVEIPLTDDMRKLAKINAKKIGTLKNSIRKGDGNMVGCLGEIAFAYLMDGTLDNDYDHDVEVNGVTFEVKTKETTVVPTPDYEGSVATCNLKQKANAYVFMRVSKDLQTAWLCGIIRNDLFLSNARRLKKGQNDGSNGFIVKQDCLNMYYRDMILTEKAASYAAKNGFKVLS